MQGLREAPLLDFLSSRKSSTFAGEVYRATRRGLDPTTPSTAGGRWMAKDGPAVLYTALDMDGALAEISFHLGQLTPPPQKPILLHRLRATAEKVLTITYDDFQNLQIDRARFGALDYKRCQVIGDAAYFLGFDAFLVPSARWKCQNLILLPDNQRIEISPEVLETKEMQWLDWVREHEAVP